MLMVRQNKVRVMVNQSPNLIMHPCRCSGTV